MKNKSSYPDYSIIPGPASNVVRYYALVFGAAWLVWIPLVLSSWSILPISLPGYLLWLAGLAPISAGALMLYRESGRQGLKQLFARCGMGKFHPGWYGIGFGLPVVMILLDLGLYRLAGGQISGAPPAAWLTRYLPSTLILIPLAIFEEAGWRGFASSRLQAILGKWVRSIMLKGKIYLTATFER